MVQIDNLWDEKDTKIGGEFVNPRNIGFEFVANEAYAYDRTGDNPPIILRYNPQADKNFTAHVFRALNLAYDADSEHKGR